jgi:solute carrier family 35 protein E1
MAQPATATGRQAFNVENPGAAGMDLSPETFLGKCLTVLYFTLWYILNIAYNIYNKKALNAFPMPWTVALWQLFAGIPYVALLWAIRLRVTPGLSWSQIKELKWVACGHLGTHIGAVISLGAGAVSFTHIVKASEPVVSAFLMAVLMNKYFSWLVYSTLIPIVGGVALASLKELSFTWLGFGAAMLSNVSSALRAILAKGVMESTKGVSEQNLYAVMTIMSFFILMPFSLVIESPWAVAAAWEAALEEESLSYLLWNMGLAGFTYYLYNETAFLALGRVLPVTHAIGNTIKRVVIIVSAVIFFHTEVSLMGWVGCSIAICGTFFCAYFQSMEGKKK